MRAGAGRKARPWNRDPREMAIKTKTRPAARARIILLFMCLLVLVVMATGLGYIRISPAEVVRVIMAGLTGDQAYVQELNPVFAHVILEVRLPRILTSAIVGAGLALAGVLFQGLLLNPLADPYTLGVSAGAAFGASLSIILNLVFFGPYTLPLMAFLGAAATLAAVLALSSVDGHISVNNLILSGVIVAAILSAAISFIKYIADEQVALIIFWLMGSFVSRSWLDAGLTLIFVLAGLGAAFFYARDLNIVSLGQRTADSLGVDTRRVRLVLLVTASLVTAVCVSVSGIIGFVGLIIPHLMRFLVGPDNRALLPASALAGAILLLAADTVTRAVLPSEVPIGILTALIGGPYFCYIFRRRQLGRAYG